MPQQNIKKEVKHAYNYDYKAARNIKQKFGKSLTKPDQSLDLRKILDKYRMGQPVMVGYVEGTWEDQENPSQGINPKTLDLSEVEHIKNEAHETLSEQSKRKQLHDKKAEDKKRQKEIDEAAARRLKEKEEEERYFKGDQK